MKKHAQGRGVPPNDPSRPELKKDRLVQYVVGLCCLRHEPTAVEIVMGDMVHDKDAEEERDVDITVLVPESDGSITGLLAFEAKDEGRALDVTTIEQLWAKLEDMPSVTHKSIVSTSGFSKPAARKAKAKGITLYTVEPWLTPMRDDVGPHALPGTAKEAFRIANNLLIWLPGRTIRFCCPSVDVSMEDRIVDKTGVFDRHGRVNARFPTTGHLAMEAMGLSTAVLCTSPEALSYLPPPSGPDQTRPDGPIGMSWRSHHSVTVSDLECWIMVEGVGLHQIGTAEITGELQWTHEEVNAEFFVMREWVTRAPFAAAAVCVMPGWRPAILGMVFGPGSGAINIHRAEFTEQHQRQFRDIRLK